MRIRVECYAGHRGDETPRRLFFDSREVMVSEVLDRWFGPDHRYFKLRGADRATYIVRQDIPSHIWELTLYQASDGDMGDASQQTDMPPDPF